ncbi:MAG: DUF3578 domain-containing protein [Balneolales bacterium]|nr:DUF3578 domain-containing protein [Balneolales bacterium]
MSIPLNIQKEHLLAAVSHIKEKGIPSDAQSTYYDVLFENQRFPPKYLVSIANIYANGKELNRNTFKGGKNTECFNLLNNNGFDIVEKKQDIVTTLRHFIAQSVKEDLKTKHYLKKYSGLNVKVSFGKGDPAKVPWIAFLNESTDKITQGIYPAFFFYKTQNLLVLSYCVSETNLPDRNWPIKGVNTIKKYFESNNLGLPDSFRQSYIFKAYEPDRINDYNLNEDLNRIISIYKTTFEQPLNDQKETILGIQFVINQFIESISTSNLIYSETLSTRFIASLLTKPFVILTGLSGSGKTKLAQAFAQWVSEGKDQYCIVPVGADWTNREPLLGYPNALKPDEYVKPDNGVLDLILRASENRDLPYFLILDEMNLSHVERYFADFLSAMESKEAIPLHPSDTPLKPAGGGTVSVPPSVLLPDNLFIIGTVNIDETTNMFSPKVLDRANTIEFRVNHAEIESFLQEMKPLDMSKIEGKGANMATSFLDMARRSEFEDSDIDFIIKPLLLFFDELSKTGAEFGYRSAYEIMRLVQQLRAVDPENSLSDDDLLDIAVMQKLLPKLHGSRRKLSPVLRTLASLCVSKEIIDVTKEIFSNTDFKLTDRELVRYPLSLEKIMRMNQSAIDNGFASYAEA